MRPELYKAIEDAIAQGVSPSMIGYALTRAGWPSNLVSEALNTWLATHTKQQHTTDFKAWLKKYYRRALPAAVVVVIVNTFDSAIMLLKPWPTKILADSAFGDIRAPGPLAPYTHTSTLILITSLLTIGLFLLGALFGILRDYLLLRIGFWLNRAIKEESFRHILHLPLYHQQRLAKGDYVYRQNVVTNSLSDLVLGATSSIAQSIIMIVGVLAIMVTFNFRLTLVSVALIPFLFLTMRLLGPKLGKYARGLNEVASKTASSISEAVDNAETVQSFTLEDKEIYRVNKLWQQGYQLTKSSMWWGKLLRNANSLLVVLATSTVMYFGGTAALHHEISFGQLLIFMTYMGYLIGPVESLVTQITTRNQKLIDVHRVYEVLSDHEGIENLRRENHIPAKIQGQIRFENVSYSYNKNTVLKGVNLTIQPGEKVAIVGPSGGGKSTILKLLPLFIEPDAGRISIDNFDTQSVSLQELRRNIAWVSQAPQLFSGTIIENIYDGDIYREINTKEIADALIVANVREFAEKLPLGLETPAGENGSGMSGGQRQRIAIARALVKNAPIVCLDEPTAALDVKSENYIRDSLAEMIKGKTVIMVTHRRALLALMDTIYVLENGVLTDVKQLGGLDAYMARLEGIELQQSEATPEADVSDLVSPVIDAPSIDKTDGSDDQGGPQQPVYNAPKDEGAAMASEGTVYFH